MAREYSALLGLPGNNVVLVIGAATRTAYARLFMLTMFSQCHCISTFFSSLPFAIGPIIYAFYVFILTINFIFKMLLFCHWSVIIIYVIAKMYCIALLVITSTMISKSKYLNKISHGTKILSLVIFMIYCTFIIKSGVATYC